MRHDGSAYIQRFGDPTSWTGDWRRPGNYLDGESQEAVQTRLQRLRGMLVGMAVRGHPSKVIAAVMSVSRETVDRRLRPLGLRNPAGQVGRPAEGSRSAVKPRDPAPARGSCQLELGLWV